MIITPEQIIRTLQSAVEAGNQAANKEMERLLDLAKLHNDPSLCHTECGGSYIFVKIDRRTADGRVFASLIQKNSCDFFTIREANYDARHGSGFIINLNYGYIVNPPLNPQSKTIIQAANFAAANLISMQLQNITCHPVNYTD